MALLLLCLGRWHCSGDSSGTWSSMEYSAEGGRELMQSSGTVALSIVCEGTCIYLLIRDGGVGFVDTMLLLHGHRLSLRRREALLGRHGMACGA